MLFSINAWCFHWVVTLTVYGHFISSFLSIFMSVDFYFLLNYVHDRNSRKWDCWRKGCGAFITLDGSRQIAFQWGCFWFQHPEWYVMSASDILLFQQWVDFIILPLLSTPKQMSKTALFCLQSWTFHICLWNTYSPFLVSYQTWILKLHFNQRLKHGCCVELTLSEPGQLFSF